jgi:hypothetical protein
MGMRLVRILLVAWGLAFAVDAGADETPAAEKPPASKPARRAKRKRHHTKEEDARQACLEKCEERNMYTDCADEDGHMMPCPCHCN